MATPLGFCTMIGVLGAIVALAAETVALGAPPTDPFVVVNSAYFGASAAFFVGSVIALACGWSAAPFAAGLALVNWTWIMLWGIGVELVLALVFQRLLSESTIVISRTGIGVVMSVLTYLWLRRRHVPADDKMRVELDEVD